MKPVSPQMTDAELAYVIRVTSVISLVLLFFGISSYFSPDAWTTYEVANSIGRDFYRANTAREYSTGSLYSSAFPPVWPVIVAGFTRVTGNIYGSYLAAFLAYIGFAIAAEQFGRRAFGRRGIGLLSALLISQFLRFRSELGSGRERPLMLLELSLLGSLLIDLDNASRVRSAVLGFLAGLMVMTRFDALPAALMVLIAAPFLGVRRERILFMLGGFLVAISPWIFFSYEHFGVSFASSNKWTAISVERGDVYDYHMVPPRTLHDAPREWVAKVVGHVKPITGALLSSIVNSLFLLVLLPLAVFARWRGGPIAADAGMRRHWKALVVLGLVVLAPFSGYLVTGYRDERYFAITVWYLELLALAYIAQRDDRRFRLAIAGMAVVAMLITLARPFTSAGRSPLDSMRHQLDRAPVDTLVACLERAGATPNEAVLFQTSRTLEPLPWTFGALSGWRTLPLPTNWAWLKPRERESFMRVYHAAYVVGGNVLADTSLIHEAPLACPIPLSRVTLAGPP